MRISVNPSILKLRGADFIKGKKKKTSLYSKHHKPLKHENTSYKNMLIIMGKGDTSIREKCADRLDYITPD